jgi:orotate phosphoribosyltransferase
VNEAEILSRLEERGAVRRGHFLLSSGRHSEVYVEKARVFEDPELTARLGEQIASWYPTAAAVVSPAVGALPLGFAVALAAGARFLYAERVDGRMTLRRGFALDVDEPTVVVEDVVTTGGSAAEVHGLVVGTGANALGVAALVDRSDADLSFPMRALARVAGEAFDPSACPRCAEGSEPESPGSRRLG